MQATLREPDAVAIPLQQFQARAGAVAKQVGAAVAGQAAQRLLDAQGQAIDAQAHVHGLEHQPGAGDRQHSPSPRSTWASQAGSTESGRLSCQPLGCCKHSVAVDGAGGV